MWFLVATCIPMAWNASTPVHYLLIKYEYSCMHTLTFNVMHTNTIIDTKVHLQVATHKLNYNKDKCLHCSLWRDSLSCRAMHGNSYNCVLHSLKGMSHFLTFNDIYLWSTYHKLILLWSYTLHIEPLADVPQPHFFLPP